MVMLLKVYKPEVIKALDSTAVFCLRFLYFANLNFFNAAHPYTGIQEKSSNQRHSQHLHRWFKKKNSKRNHLQTK